MDTPPIVSREQWLEARREHLKSEKALTRMHDLVMEERRRLPWVRVDKAYRFDTTTGEKTLAELFDGRSQLIVYHFMFGPGWEEGCTGCSFISDHIDAANLHLPHHDVTLVAVSRAPLAEFLPYKERMGWRFEWVSSAGSDFNYDFGVAFRPEQVASGEPLYNFGTLPPGDRGPARRKRLHPRRERRDLPHLFELRARRRHVDRRPSVARPDAARPQREEHDGLGPPPRPV